MGKLLQKNIGNPLQKISNSLFYNCDTLPHKKTLTRLGKTSHENTPPCKSGGFHLKGYEMKKYIPLDFDEKGKVILGREKNTPTPNGTIPAIFIPGGSDENKQGLKSISISPAITTTPALDTISINYDDLTEEQKTDGVVKFATAIPDGSTTYTITVTPTSDWYAQGDNGWGEKGEPVTVTGWYEDGFLSVDTIVAAEPYDGMPTGEFIIGSLILSPTVIESVTVTPNIEGLSYEIAKYLPLHISENQNVNIDDLHPSATTDYSITVTPNENAYAFDYDANEYGAKGQPVTYTVRSDSKSLIFVVSGAPTVDGVASNMRVQVGGK